jgi:hypothetical protein
MLFTVTVPDRVLTMLVVHLVVLFCLDTIRLEFLMGNVLGRRAEGSHPRHRPRQRALAHLRTGTSKGCRRFR